MGSTSHCSATGKQGVNVIRALIDDIQHVAARIGAIDMD
jgi:hypothetical protein